MNTEKPMNVHTLKEVDGPHVADLAIVELANLPNEALIAVQDWVRWWATYEGPDVEGFLLGESPVNIRFLRKERA